jgi:hypothetical protein
MTGHEPGEDDQPADETEQNGDGSSQTAAQNDQQATEGGQQATEGGQQGTDDEQQTDESLQKTDEAEQDASEDEQDADGDEQDTDEDEQSASGTEFGSGSFFEKVEVLATVNANWDDPIEHVALEVGYPDSDDEVVRRSVAQYVNAYDNDSELSEERVPAVWTEETEERGYKFEFTKDEDRWNPDTVRLRKTVSYEQRPNVLVDDVEAEWTTDEKHVDVRVDQLGELDVGPITVDAPLISKQVAAFVTFDNPDLPKQRFEFTAEKDEPRYWRAWYESPEDVPPYRCKVEAVVEGNKMGQDAIRWESDWREYDEDGALVVDVPTVKGEKRERVEEYLNDE